MSLPRTKCTVLHFHSTFYFSNNENVQRKFSIPPLKLNQIVVVKLALWCGGKEVKNLSHQNLNLK